MAQFFQTTIFFLLFANICISQSSSGCGKKAPAENGSTKQYFFANQGYNRSYIVHIPTNWNQNSASGQPLVVGLHGYTNTAQNFQKSFEMNSQADSNNYLAVYLQATYFNNPNPPHNSISSWNDGDCGKSPGPEGPTCDPFSVNSVPRPVACDDPDGNKCNWCNCLVDDVAAIDQLAAMIESDYCVDISREYVLGFSQGGMLTHRVACELANRFAAAAPFHGVQHLGFGCEPATNITMPLFEVWGTNDHEVPGQAVLSQDGWYYIPVSGVQEIFATHNGCDLSGGVVNVKTVSDGIDGWKCIGWMKGCKNNATTVSCSWDGTHTYPVRGNTNFGLTVAWNFMKQFVRVKS